MLYFSGISGRWGHKLIAKYWFDPKSGILVSKEILTFDNIEIEKKNVPSWKSYFLKDVGIEKTLVSNKISSGEKTINTLLITCITIIELSHYI